MSRFLSADEEARIVAAIKAKKRRTLIAIQTGRSEGCIRYVAAKYGLEIHSRYQLTRRGTYWLERIRRQALRGDRYGPCLRVGFEMSDT